MAHIICSAEKVRAAALVALDKIYATRKERDERRIIRTMESRRTCWWKFWQPLGISREEAIAYLEYMAEPMFGWESLYRSGHVNALQSLLLLAEHGDPVTIDAKSASILWGE